MRRSGAAIAIALSLWLFVAAPALAGPPASSSRVASAEPASRFALAGGCYELRSNVLARPVGKADGGYSARAASPERFRMQATALGRYLFYGVAQDFMAASGSSAVVTASDASDAADWVVNESGGEFTARSTSGRALAVARDSGRLVLVTPGSAGDAERFSFVSSTGCATFPEAEIGVVGAPSRGPSSIAETRGLLEGHLHAMAFEFLGGGVRCGKPWDRFGITKALVDCIDHQPNGAGAVLENTLSTGNPVGTHDPVGWPTFRDWPRQNSFTHEQVYYKWLERSWRGGLRLMVQLMVENEVLCDVYPIKKNSCNEMESVRRQIRLIREFEGYIDAQSGGPGKGWFRVVTNPFEARRVINDGKLAVVLGIEVSKLFDCDVYNEVPECDKAQIDRQLDEVHRAGVRDLELVNKFDNALGGVAMDAGSTGVLVNNGNKLQTGRYWDVETCRGPAEDEPQSTTAGPAARDQLVGGVLKLALPGGTAPAYPPPPHCNTRRLTDLGEHLIRRMTQKKMIVDIDHLNVYSRQQALSLLEAERYSGVISSHSWADEPSYPRIYRLGGVISPSDNVALEERGPNVPEEGFVQTWRNIRKYRSPRHYFGFGFGSDLNGFSSAPKPRRNNQANPVRYPFKSFDGKQTIFRQRSGSRVWDVNVDGVAHYGLYPDWIEDLRKVGGDQIVEDMARGPEAYLQMWERAEGVPAITCRARNRRISRRGLGRLRLGQSPELALRRAGQPNRRLVRAFRWCVRGKPGARNRAAAVFTPARKVGLIVSTVHGTKTTKPGRSSKRLPRGSRRFGKRLRVKRLGRSRLLIGVRRGKVRYVAVATRRVARNPRTARRYLRLAGIRP